MDNEEALSLLRDEARQYAGRSRDSLIPIIDAPIHYRRTALSGRVYQIEIEAMWDDAAGDVLRLQFEIDDGGARAFFPLARSALLAEEETFDGRLGS